MNSTEKCMRRGMMRRFWLVVALSSNLACSCGAFGTGGPVAFQRNIPTSRRTSTLHRAVAVKEETSALPTETTTTITTTPVVRRRREHVPIRHVPETVVAKEAEDANEKVAVTRRSRTVLASAAASSSSNDDDPQCEDPSASRTSAASSSSSETTDTGETEDRNDDDDLAAQRRQAAQRAALLAKGRRTRTSPSKGSKTNTSVGARRVASASKGRLQATASSKLADALRKTAQGTAAAKRKQNNDNDNNNDMSTSKAQQPPGQPLLDLNVPTIHSTIDELLQAQKPSFDTTTTKRKEELTAAFSSFDMPTTRPSMGIIGEPDLATKSTTTTTTTLVDITDTNNMFVEVDDDDDECQPLYYPGATILGPDDDEDTTLRNKRRGRKRRFTVRVATPADDVPISSLRLSVFSHFTAAQQGQFCSRSCQAIAGRRVRGATCLVASMPCAVAAAASQRQRQPPSLVVGSIECSFHEFFSTRLGQRRPQFSLLYITEVAVHPASRRQGIGRDLLLAADKYAASRGVETLYLHVDVTNHGAIQLYEQAGYRRVRDRLGNHGPDHNDNNNKNDNNKNDDDPPVSVFMEFTKSLNLHPGATRGREHFLLCKDLTPHPTWLEERPSVVVVEQGADDDDDDDNDDEHDKDNDDDNNDDTNSTFLQHKKKQPQHGWNSLVEGTFGFAIPA